MVEAHPSGSDSPYSGDEWTGVFSKDEEGNPVTQPETYEDRLAIARQTAADEGITSLMLVDEIDNPVWCTYGPAPNIAYLIGRDGIIVTGQQWYDPGEMENAIQAYLESH